MRYSASTSTAARTTSARPSTTGSPQPTRPSSVSIRQNSQRGGTRKVSTRVIFIWLPSGPGQAESFTTLQPPSTIRLVPVT